MPAINQSLGNLSVLLESLTTARSGDLNLPLLKHVEQSPDANSRAVFVITLYLEISLPDSGFIIRLFPETTFGFEVSILERFLRSLFVVSLSSILLGSSYESMIDGVRSGNWTYLFIVDHKAYSELGVVGPFWVYWLPAITNEVTTKVVRSPFKWIDVRSVEGGSELVNPLSGDGSARKAFLVEL